MFFDIKLIVSNSASDIDRSEFKSPKFFFIGGTILGHFSGVLRKTKKKDHNHDHNHDKDKVLL